MKLEARDGGSTVVVILSTDSMMMSGIQIQIWIRGLGTKMVVIEVRGNVGVEETSTRPSFFNASTVNLLQDLYTFLICLLAFVPA